MEPFEKGHVWSSRPATMTRRAPFSFAQLLTLEGDARHTLLRRGSRTMQS